MVDEQRAMSSTSPVWRELSAGSARQDHAAARMAPDEEIMMSSDLNSRAEVYAAEMFPTNPEFREIAKIAFKNGYDVANAEKTNTKDEDI